MLRRFIFSHILIQYFPNGTAKKFVEFLAFHGSMGLTVAELCVTVAELG